MRRRSFFQPLSVCLLGGLFAAFVFADAPKPGLTAPCEVVEWHDGDTCTVRVTLDVRVRLLDCWAPEVHGRSMTEAEKKLPPEKQKEIQRQITAEKQKGFDSKASAMKFAPVGSSGVLEIPLDGIRRSDEAFTMGRVLGRVWIGGKDVSALQVSSGHATATK